MTENANEANETARPFGAPVGGLSHVVGPTDDPLWEKTIPQVLAGTAARFPDREAAVFRAQGIRRTWSEFAAEVDRLAAAFLSLGLEKGDRVGIWSPNRHEWVLTQFATARIGIILVNINPAYRLSELDYALNKVGCKALVTAASFKTSDYIGMIRTLAPELAACEPGRLVSKNLPHLKWVVGMSADAGSGILSFDELMAMGTEEGIARLDAITGTLAPNDAINIQFTSGTTGAPKGATLTHRNIVNNARFVTGRINFTESDRLCIPVPLYHCFGMVMGVLGCVAYGSAMIFPGEGFEAEPALEALEEEKCTACYGVPTMFIAMLEALKAQPRDLSSMRTGVMAGAPCPEQVMKRVNADMNMPEVTICYGMTETSPVSFQSFVDDPTDKRCATVGRIHPHLEVRIVDETGRTVPVGEQGELCTKGYSVMLGYWDEEERTADAIRDGWMHTGDLARIDAEGFCSITGRVKDMIIRGGENVYPREIEEFLFRHPKVSAVQVFGVPDEKYGEIVCAWIIPAPGEDVDPEEIREFCRGQIAHYKVPAHVRIVAELPMTITGKPQKFIMRDQMVDMLAQGA
ncbi:AMP-binding protein [Zhengella mangrovi]|uniref:3-methylmercaptopropionyl-CoA ligase n=1 Tax=Zhengella mangrovi TaxID=1982044 RepID=A0A2G1QMH1_9HYPH|nr:AMP-binding protein [Zhengella mangrovi]PHP66660.1 AMP-binding protein [Zhengella mangrovi]